MLLFCPLFRCREVVSEEEVTTHGTGTHPIYQTHSRPPGRSYSGRTRRGRNRAHLWHYSARSRFYHLGGFWRRLHQTRNEARKAPGRRRHTSPARLHRRLHPRVAFQNSRRSKRLCAFVEDFVASEKVVG